MRGKAGRIIFALFLIFLGILFMTGSLKIGQPRLSATQPRRLSELGELLQSQPKPPKNVASASPSFTTTQEGNTTKITFAGKASDEAPFYDFTVHEIPLNGSLPLGQGSISLDAIRMAMPAPKDDPEHSDPLPASCFTSDLAPMSEAEASRRSLTPSDRSLFVHGVFPVFAFHFSLSNAPAFKFLRAEVRDARTGARLSYGYSSGSAPGGLVITSEIAMWHKGPVIVALDIAHGPTEVAEIPFAVGAVIPHSLGELKLQSIIPGKFSGLNSRSTMGQIEMKLVQDGNTNATTALFFGLPYLHHAPVDFQFVNKRGQIVPNLANTVSVQFSVLSLSEQAGEIDKVRATRHTQLKRLYLRLPWLPGLPSQNDGITDLLDVQAPYVSFRGEWEMEFFIRGSAQCTLQRPWSTTQLNESRRAYTNATPRMILQELRALTPAPHRLIIDEQENNIVFRPPFLREFLRRIFP